MARRMLCAIVVLAAFAAMTGSACREDATPRTDEEVGPSHEGTDPEAVFYEEPRRVAGDSLTLTMVVDEVVGPHSLHVMANDEQGDPILVLHDDPTAPRRDDVVEITGTVVKFDKRFLRDLPFAVDLAVLQRHLGDYGLMAIRIDDSIG